MTTGIFPVSRWASTPLNTKFKMNDASAFPAPVQLLTIGFRVVRNINKAQTNALGLEPKLKTGGVGGT